MNREVCMVALMVCAQGATAQNFNEWFRQKKTQKKYLLQQIAALKVYLGYLKEGYDVVQTGLNTIGDIRQGKFDLDIEYVESLKHVNSAVSGSAKITSIAHFQRMIMIEFRKLKDFTNETDVLTNDEKEYIRDVYANMLRESELSLDELDRVLSNSDFEMTDDERIKRIDLIYVDMKDKYTFTKSFSNSTKLLIAQRMQEKGEVLVQQELVLK